MFAFNSKISIYYLPGRNETRLEHAGAVLTKAGLSFHGRDMTADFLRLAFDRQIQAVLADIKKGYMDESSLIIGRSYGGYLVLHAMCEMATYPGNVLLLNPVLGRYLNTESACGIIPPRADRLLRLAKEGVFPSIRSLVIVSGEKDTQCPSGTAREFIQALKGDARLIVVPGQGHGLDEAVLSDVLKGYFEHDLRWTKPSGS